MTFIGTFPDRSPKRDAVARAFRADETTVVTALLAHADIGAAARSRVSEAAHRLVEEMRRRLRTSGGLDAFLHEYGLSTQEGVVLMCLAEALLRIPDAKTANRLIHEKLGEADWNRHLGRSDSLFVNASTWALMLTGRIIQLEDEKLDDVGAYVGRLIAKSGEPVIRQAMVQAMRILGRQFVMGETIGEALKRAREAEEEGERHSYDMLGEAARTAADADRYFRAYEQAIAAVGEESAGRGPHDGPGISIKLSALHPRYEFSQHERIRREMFPRLAHLVRQAKQMDIGLCIDAEEADRLDLQLDAIEALTADPSLAGWEGLGLAVQAYQKRAFPLIDWLTDVALRNKRRLMVRLVKGAYWDTEIKRGQEQGLESYSVFTRKVSTDLSYIACARKILANAPAFYSQFATHNAHTLATILELAGGRRDLEFQRLHGMGEALYQQIRGPSGPEIKCRVYAPVGGHQDLLGYLVRRLLENGSNTSFVNRLVDAPVEEIVQDPWERVSQLRRKPHPRIPLPKDLFQAERRNSMGRDLSDPAVLAPLAKDMATAEGPWHAAPPGVRGQERRIHEPRDRTRIVGAAVDATPEDVEHALARAARAAPGWEATKAEERAAMLDRASDMLEAAMPAFMALAVREGGKTIPDALSEVREAVDFCRYYAFRARSEFARPTLMPGPTGEHNELSLHGRGVFATISPWNFPLAIFLGQTTAALAAGNAVIAKPSEQTPLIAARAVQILHAAGIPAEGVQLLPGPGATVGTALVRDSRISGVAFTGSDETARRINRALAERPGPIVPFIAETGGQNAMIVDSTALPEQVVADVIMSAFRSAGQRCSALRVLFLQEDIAERVIVMLQGATEELRVGDPALLQTDVGPVIDADAVAMLEKHAARMDKEARLLVRATLSDECGKGTYFAPRAYEIESIGVLKGEVFGPILHVVRYDADRLDAVVEAINGTGYGLTFGVHSRLDSTARALHARVRAGNAYVNRNTIGAVVGVQPFGGEGLSGTGPKAGGPRYLHRFATERALAVNTTATGGNPALLSIAEDD